MSEQVQALIDLQLPTGARAGELVMMRPIDLNTNDEVWTYRPGEHKTAHHGYERTIYLGPKAQAVIAPFMASRSLETYMFCPYEAEQTRRAKQHTQRKTPLSCGNRPGTNRVIRHKRAPT